ncbi:MAG: DUF4097 family beta strand repeat-containing protein [Bacteroidota bacterium]
MMRVNKYLVFMVLLSLAGRWCRAQTKVEVITKTVEKSFAYQSGYSLQVDGKSAKIDIKGWKGTGIKVVMKLISKGLNAEVAKKELEYQKYAMDEINKSIVIRNYLLLPRNLDELSTIQESEIQVYVPKNVKLEVKNAFGETHLGQITGEVSLENEYGDIFITGLAGPCRIQSFFGDLKLVMSSGTLTLNISHTETNILGFSGSARITTNLGNVSIQNLGEVSSIRIDGQKADIDLQVSDIHQYSWNVRSKYGQIEAPADMTKELKSIKNAKLEYGDQALPNIQITTDFGSVEIVER